MSCIRCPSSAVSCRRSRPAVGSGVARSRKGRRVASTVRSNSHQQDNASVPETSVVNAADVQKLSRACVHEGPSSALRQAVGPATIAEDCRVLVERLREASLGAWRSYEGELSARPLRTKALTSMVGLALGDLIAQAGTGYFDPMRSARMATFGLLLHGTSGHFWYQLLDAKVMPQRSSSTAAIVTKMLLDQIIFSPICTTVFYAALTAMEGRPEDIAEVVSARLIPTVLSGYALWPLAHLVSFKFVPSQYRLLYINAVNLVWTVHLSKLASAPMACDPASVAPVYGSAVTSPQAALPGGLAPIPVSNSIPTIPSTPPPTDFVFVPEHITPHEI